MRHPELDGTNYPYWKARMTVYIKAHGERVWRSVVTGWPHPTKPGETPEAPRVIKPEEEWTDAEIVQADYNSKDMRNSSCYSG